MDRVIRFEGSTNVTQLSLMSGLAVSPVLTSDTILVDVQLFGHPFSFIIDTGAGCFFDTPQHMEALCFK